MDVDAPTADRPTTHRGRIGTTPDGDRPGDDARPAPQDLVWPPPADELDAVEVVALRSGDVSTSTSAPPAVAVPLPPPADRLDVADVDGEVVIDDGADDLSLFGDGIADAEVWRARAPRRRWAGMAAAASIGLASAVGIIAAVEWPTRTTVSTPADGDVATIEVGARNDTAASSLPAPSTPATPAASEGTIAAPTPSAEHPPASATEREARTTREGAAAEAPRDVSVTAPVPPLSQRASTDLPRGSSVTPRASIDTTRVTTEAPVAAPPPSDASSAPPPAPRTPTRVIDALPAGAVAAASPPAASAPVPKPSASRSASGATPGETTAPSNGVRADEAAVRETIGEYASAYRRLDARAAQDVWPTVDAGALARAFSGLSSQSLDFARCDLDVRGTVASAECLGRATYVTRVGSRAPRTESRTWRFTLRKDGSAWHIVDAATR